MRKFWRQLLLSLVIAVVLTVAGVVILEFKWRDATLIALFFSTTLAAVANAAYLVRVLKGRLQHAGPSIAHVGFALVLLGALISTGRKDKVSENTGGINVKRLGKGFSNTTDLVLFKGDTVRMGQFFVQYTGKRQEGVNLYYDMDYFAVRAARYAAGDTVRVRNSLFRARDAHEAGAEFLADQPAHWEPLEDYPRRALWHAERWRSHVPGDPVFRLEPIIQLNPRFGNVAEPSTEHWPARDLYTHIRYADQALASDTADDDWMPDQLQELTVGDTLGTPTQRGDRGQRVHRARQRHQTYAR